jgi:hypothetical protein
MTRGYPARPCIVAGDKLTLHVTTDAPRYRCVVFRCGARNVAVSAEPRWVTDAVAELETAPDWIPGAYVVGFVTDPREDPVRTDRSSGTLDARSARALLTVRRERASAPLLVILPLFTYHAYNVADVDGTRGESEGECLYSGAEWVSLHRPGGGIGGHPWDEVNVDFYDRATPRQTFAHWDAKALAWLEREGFVYDCCTDLEIHEGSVDLREYRAIASFGHHEYWTRAMRDRIDGFIESGGHAAFFGGNTCWFEAEYDSFAHAIRRAGRWNENPEWKTTGVSYAYGGGKWIGERPATGYVIAEPRHWIFHGLQASRGGAFGFEKRLIGYECDGVPAASDMLVLARAPISHWRVDDGSGEVSEHACAAMGLREAGGLVFTASTVDWARVLAQGEPAVCGVTRNVLRRFMT